MDASVASLVVNAPGLFMGSSNQPISCLSMAWKPTFLRRRVSSSPDLAKAYPWNIKSIYRFGLSGYVRLYLLKLDTHLHKLGKETYHTHSTEQNTRPVDLVPLFVNVADGKSLKNRQKYLLLSTDLRVFHRSCCAACATLTPIIWLNRTA